MASTLLYNTASFNDITLYCQIIESNYREGICRGFQRSPVGNTVESTQFSFLNVFKRDFESSNHANHPSEAKNLFLFQPRDAV